jgi:hypothetical protein
MPVRDKDSIEISFHYDTGSEAHPAINVKVHGSLCRRVQDVDVPSCIDSEHAWDIMVEQWWRDATIIAHEFGYSGVFAEGRSGGWLVPFYQSVNGKLQKFGFPYPEWSGQGGDRGYPYYPDMEDKKERRRFVKFREKIEELLNQVPELYKESIDRMVQVLDDEV